MNVNKKVTFYFSAFLLALGLVVFAGQTPPAVLADGLPPRETPTSGQGGDGNGGAAAGAYIELVAPGHTGRKLGGRFMAGLRWRLARR